MPVSWRAFLIPIPQCCQCCDLQVLPIEWSALPLCMMVVVCGMQWLWFYKIVRMATGADDAHGKKEA